MASGKEKFLYKEKEVELVYNGSFILWDLINFEDCIEKIRFESTGSTPEKGWRQGRTKYKYQIKASNKMPKDYKLLVKIEYSNGYEWETKYITNENGESVAKTVGCLCYSGGSAEYYSHNPIGISNFTDDNYDKPNSDELGFDERLSEGKIWYSNDLSENNLYTYNNSSYTHNDSEGYSFTVPVGSSYTHAHTVEYKKQDLVELATYELNSGDSIEHPLEEKNNVEIVSGQRNHIYVTIELVRKDGGKVNVAGITQKKLYRFTLNKLCRPIIEKNDWFVDEFEIFNSNRNRDDGDGHKVIDSTLWYQRRNKADGLLDPSYQSIDWTDSDNGMREDVRMHPINDNMWASEKHEIKCYFEATDFKRSDYYRFKEEGTWESPTREEEFYSDANYINTTVNEVMMTQELYDTRGIFFVGEEIPADEQARIDAVLAAREEENGGDD